MTLRRLVKEFVAARDRKRDEYERDVHVAWRVEFFARQKRLKPLKQYLQQASITASGQMSKEQVRTFMHALAAKVPGRFVEVTH